MAFIKCSGGGKLKETVLWENDNTNTNWGSSSVANKEVTLPVTSISDYDYLKFIATFDKTTTPETANKTISLTSYDFFKTTGNAIGNPKCAFGATLTSSSPNNYYTRLWFRGNSDIIIVVSAGNGMNSSGRSWDHLIPYQFIGMKY